MISIKAPEIRGFLLPCRYKIKNRMKEKAIQLIKQFNEFLSEANQQSPEDLAPDVNQFTHAANFCNQILSNTTIAKGLHQSETTSEVVAEILEESATSKPQVLLLSKAAKAYYESTWPKNFYSGYEKYILTNGTESTFVRNDYVPGPGEALFYCKAINQKTIIQLHRI